MKVFFDTNVLLSAFISQGSCQDIFERCMLRHTMIISEFVISEIQEKLQKKFKFNDKEIYRIIQLLKNHALIAGEQKIKPTSRDKDDDHILSAALYAQADCILTGDNDLLVLKKFKGIPILKPSEFWRFEIC